MVSARQSATGLPTVEDIWAWLADVPDPEIPVISVRDLGIVRAVDENNGRFVVTVTPTYSGCPATAVIALDIQAALRARGCNNVEIKTRLSPAWTTDWITAEGRAKLLSYGIAPPEGQATCAGMLSLSGVAPQEIQCPRCQSTDTERVSQFGSTPCKASYRCRTCLEPFDYFKAI
ncbi:MAG: 1,2-phenylacetyl-CoA epoxidase subunit PaaD [Pseudomonadota bacterium]